MRSVWIGTAAWAIPRDVAATFPKTGSALERYATRFDATEINSTFSRRHRASTFQRWHEAVPAAFRFSVKLPRSITHDAALARPRALLQEFFADVAPLGTKLGPILVQLPPSLALVPRTANRFFERLRALHAGPVVCEPRHASWYEPVATALLQQHEVARVAADPPRPAAAAEPGGFAGLEYLRLHGSPRRYYSSYSDDASSALAERIARSPVRDVWVIFDNTASGAATGDALRLQAALVKPPRGAGDRPYR